MSKNDYTSRWESGSRYEILYRGYSYLTVSVINPSRINIDVSLTVARTKCQAPGNFIIKMNTHEGSGIWALSTETKQVKPISVDTQNPPERPRMFGYDEFLENDLCEILDQLVKEWSLRLIEMV